MSMDVVNKKLEGLTMSRADEMQAVDDAAKAGYNDTGLKEEVIGERKVKGPTVIHNFAEMFADEKCCANGKANDPTGVRLKRLISDMQLYALEVLKTPLTF